MITDIYTTFVSKHWKLYSILILTLIALPLQKIAMPHYYGKIIDSLKNHNINNSKYLFGVILLIWIVIQCLGIVTAYVNKIINPI